MKKETINWLVVVTWPDPVRRVYYGTDGGSAVPDQEDWRYHFPTRDKTRQVAKELREFYRQEGFIGKIVTVKETVVNVGPNKQSIQREVFR